MRLDQSEERFRLLVESVKDYGIFILTPEGCVDTWNAGAERLKGYRADEIVGRHFSAFYPESDVASGKCELELESATRDGRFEDEGWRVRKDGTLFWANVVITALRAPNGQLVGFAKVTRDLTERRDTEEKLRKLAAERAALAEKARVQEFQERFLAILGHDLRNPLGAIQMGSELLLRQGAIEGPPARVLERMNVSARRMSKMIEQILDLARARLGGGLQLVVAPTDLSSTLARIVDELRTAHPGRSIELDCPSLTGEWDVDRLEQVFSNLVGNAIHHGSGSPVVITAGQLESGVVRIDVQNYGKPIPEALLSELFNPFRRGDRDARSAQTAGLGLGLYISREIVQAHGGTIEARSTEVEGTTFRVRLPPQAPHPIVNEDES